MEEGNQTESDLIYAQKLLDRHGAVKDTLDRAKHYADKACDALAIFPDSEWKAALLEAVAFCIARSH
jgi:octaprenyl-diphosphate synthase